MEDKQKLFVVTSLSSEDVAIQLAQELLENQFAACVNIIPHVRSIYRWKGNIVDDREAITVIKTRSDQFDSVSEIIHNISGYEVPEILAFKVAKGSKAFLNWIDSCIDGTSE